MRRNGACRVGDASTKHGRKAFPIAVFIALLHGSATYAEESEVALRNVVVSASKVEQATSEAPSNVSVVTSGAIENSNAIRLGDVLTSQVPSLHLRGGAVGNTTRDAGTSIITLRGAYGARTKVLLDGVTNMSDANSANLNLSTLSLDDVERIEVVPGVSSSLYGSDAIGGVINVITKVPTKREIGAKVVNGYGDGERTMVAGSYRDRFANGLGISLSYYDQHMAGYAKNDFVTVAPNVACGVCTTVPSGWEKTLSNTGLPTYIIGDKGATPSDTYNINGALFFDVSPTSKLKAGITRYHSKVGYSPYDLYLNTTMPKSNLSIDGKRLAMLRDNYPSSFLSGDNVKDETRYFAGYEGKIGSDYLLKLDWSYFDRDYYYLTPDTAAGSTTTSYAGGPGKTTHAPNVAKDLAAQLSFPVGDRHFMVTGLVFNRASLHRDVYTLSNWRDDGSRIATTDTGVGYTETNSVYLQDQISVTPALTIYAGARYDDWKTFGDVVNATATRSIAKHGESAVSPRLAGVYKLTNAVSLKASVGTAFRAPTLYDLYAADTVFAPKYGRSDPNLKPEKAKAADIGTEINLPDGTNLKAAYFRTRISDMIYSKETPYTNPLYPTVTTLSEKTNAAEGVTKGIELSGDTRIASWLKASASYTWTDARIVKDSTGTGLMDKRLIYVPKNMASFGLDARYQAWSAALSARYSGLVYTNANNSDIEKEVFGGTSKYWITDVRVAYQFDKNFKVAVMVNNLFDQKYYQYYLMPGRNAAIELSAKF